MRNNHAEKMIITVKEYLEQEGDYKQRSGLIEQEDYDYFARFTHERKRCFSFSDPFTQKSEDDL